MAGAEVYRSATPYFPSQCTVDETTQLERGHCLKTDARGQTRAGTQHVEVRRRFIERFPDRLFLGRIKAHRCWPGRRKVDESQGITNTRQRMTSVAHQEIRTE